MRIDARPIRAALAACFVAAALPAAACGFCIEDKVAAVYDQSVVEGAVARQRHVAFFSIEGEPHADAATRRAVGSALEKGGGLRGTARVALENAACSIAYDPKRTDPARLAAAAGRALASRHLFLKALRVIDDTGKLGDAAQ